VDALRQIRVARVRSIYDRLVATSLITVANGALVTAATESTAPSPWPLVWLGLVILLAAARLASQRAYRRDGGSADRVDRWELVAVIGSALSGALWGLGAASLFPADETGQWLWILLIAGMCAGAATLHAAHLPTALAYIVPAGVPLLVRMALSGSGPRVAAAAMMVVFLAALSFTAQRFSRQFGHVFFLQHDLEERTMALNEANRRLREEIRLHQSTEATLQQAQKMEALGQVTGGIAHDFNNLLTVITGNLDLIKRRAPEDEGVLRLAAAASHAARRGATLIGSLLSFARKQTLRPEPVDLNRLIEEFAPLLRRAAGEPVTLRLDLSADTATSHADATHFQSAMLNLVINARDAMPGGGEVVISTRNVETAGLGADLGDEVERAVVVCVRDNGPGMPPEIVGKAFDPFFTTKDIGKGSGLGLSQVYGFSRQSGGYAKIESKPGEGAAVSIVLPALAAAAASRVSPAPATGPMALAATPMRVLLVEDDAEVLTTLCEQMLPVGWDVVTARDGATGLALLEADREIDVLVTDVMMPGGISGGELARRGASLRRGLAVLLISGYPGAAVEDCGAGEGEFDLLAKPFSQEQLIERVLAAVAARRNGAETVLPT
jgi:signal transduction histidine kinase/ActR/RegA family two-component response regulator